MKTARDTYRFRPILFFACAYFFTWVFWIPAIFAGEELGAVLMLIGLLAPGVVSTIFVLVSGSDELKQDLKNKIVGFYKVNWLNVFKAILVFALIIVCSILLSLLFGQSLSQFAFTEDFSFTGVGIGTALVTILLASIIEEVGWKGYCEDSIGQYMNWFWESLLFGILWSGGTHGQPPVRGQLLPQRNSARIHYHLGVPRQRPVHSGMHAFSPVCELHAGEDRHDAGDQMRRNHRCRDRHSHHRAAKQKNVLRDRSRRQNPADPLRRGNVK